MASVQQEKICSPNEIDGHLQSILDHPAVTELVQAVRPRSRLKGHHKYLFHREKARIDHTDVNVGEMDSPIKAATSTVLTIPEVFDELALVACEAGVVCRKELLETFAAATAIHTHFLQNRAFTRVADLAAGHGLLSWFLLVLDDSYDFGDDSDSTNGRERRNLTAVCIDRRKPAAADIIAKAMLHRYPHLHDRWTYIQADVLSTIDPHSSCLMASVHACGTLSDVLIELSIEHTAPLAIVPCCHTINSRMGYQPHALSGMDNTDVVALVQKEKEKRQQEQNGEERQQWGKHEVTLANAVDSVRCLTMRNAGYHVKEVMLPEKFTPRNRLLLGEPPIQQKQNNYCKRPAATANEMPPMFCVPLADDPESIALCQAIGEISSDAQTVTRLRVKETTGIRKVEPKHYCSQHLSVWLPSPIAMTVKDSHQQHNRNATSLEGNAVNARKGDSNDDPLDHGSSILVDSLQELADQFCAMNLSTAVGREIDINGHMKEKITHLRCSVEVLGNEQVLESTGRWSQLYRFKYFKSGADNGTTTVDRASRLAAKNVHSTIRQSLVEKFGDDVLR